MCNYNKSNCFTQYPVYRHGSQCIAGHYIEDSGLPTDFYIKVVFPPSGIDTLQNWIAYGASSADIGLDPKSGPLSGGEILVHGNLVPLT